MMQDDDDGSTKDVTVSNDGDQSTDDKRDTSIRDKEDDEAQKEDNQSNDIHKKSPNDDESVNPEENSSDRVDSNDGQKGVDNGDIVLQMDDMEGSKDGEDEESSQDPEDENSETSGEHALEDFWSKNTPPPAYRDYDGEQELSKPDTQKRKRSQYHWIRTVIRGRSFAFVPIFLSVSWSALAVYLARLAARNSTDKIDCRWGCSPLALKSNTHSYVGFAVFLLLEFRVNESYARYMEGMRIWTSIGGTVNSTSKYFLLALPCGMFHEGDRERMLGWLVAFPATLKRELRGERDLRELKNVLAPEDLVDLQNAPNMASRTLYVLTAYILKAREMEDQFPQSFLVHLLSWISDLNSYADMCTQIKGMPCAFSYVAHLRTFLTLWLFFLPFTLVESKGWGTQLIVAFITYGVVGVEQNAAELENPFGKAYNDLPLGMLVKNIRDGVVATYRAAQYGTEKYVHETGSVQPEEGDSFWLEFKKMD